MVDINIDNIIGYLKFPEKNIYQQPDSWYSNNYCLTFELLFTEAHLKPQRCSVIEKNS